MKEKRTNLETIRACSAEELGIYIAMKFSDACPGSKAYNRETCHPIEKKCPACWQEWLLQPESDEWDLLWEQHLEPQEEEE